MQPIKQGSIYWLDDCKPLDDDNAKRRPVVVVDDPKSLKTADFIAVVACTTKCRDSEPDQIQLPDRIRIPATKSGLPKPTWAIPRWHLPVRRDRLTEYAGHLTGNVLKSVVAAYLVRCLAEKD